MARSSAIAAEALGPTVTDPIVVTFHDVPAGGTVEVTVAFYSNNGYLVGRGSTGRVPNVIQSGNSVMKTAITIEELKVPLLDTTVYSHKQRLNYIGGQYEWVVGDAPTAAAHGAAGSR